MRLALHATRRQVFAGAALGALVWASRPFTGSADVRRATPTIIATRVGRAPTDPEDQAWDEASAITVSLNPQTVVVPRIEEAGAKSIEVRALFDQERLAFLLEWRDAHPNLDLGTVLQYRDAVALQFPEDLSLGTPPVTMGQKGQGVVIYHWKSDWQFGRLRDVDEAYPNMYSDWYPQSGVPAGEMAEARDYLTRGQKQYLTAAAAGNALADPQVQEKTGPVQKMRAEGFGTIEPHPSQDAQGKGAWSDGAWRIAVVVPRQQERFRLEEGMSLPVGFAVWDGSRNERNGQKAYSFWNDLSLGAPPPAEAPKGRFVAPLLGGVGGLFVAALAVLIGFRMWRARRAPKRTS